MQERQHCNSNKPDDKGFHKSVPVDAGWNSSSLWTNWQWDWVGCTICTFSFRVHWKRFAANISQEDPSLQLNFLSHTAFAQLLHSQQSDEVLQNHSGFCLLKWFPIGTILKFVALPIAHALLKKLFWRQLFEENHCFDPFRPNEHPQVIYGLISTIRWQKYKIFLKSKKSLEFL